MANRKLASGQDLLRTGKYTGSILLTSVILGTLVLGVLQEGFSNKLVSVLKLTGYFSFVISWYMIFPLFLVLLLVRKIKSTMIGWLVISSTVGAMAVIACIVIAEPTYLLNTRISPIFKDLLPFVFSGILSGGFWGRKYLKEKN